MIDAVLAGAGHAALKSDDLRNQPIGARQHGAAAVQQWQQVAIKIGLRRLADFVADPLLAKQLARKLTSEMISTDLPDAVALEQNRKIADHGRRRKERPNLAHGVNDGLAITLLVGHGASERVLARAGSRITEG